MSRSKSHLPYHPVPISPTRFFIVLKSTAAFADSAAAVVTARAAVLCPINSLRFMLVKFNQHQALQARMEFTNLKASVPSQPLQTNAGLPFGRLQPAYSLFLRCPNGMPCGEFARTQAHPHDPIFIQVEQLHFRQLDEAGEVVMGDLLVRP